MSTIIMMNASHPKPAVSSHWLLLLGALLFGVAGCALVPGVPAGPIGGPGVRLGATYAYAYAPAAAQTLQPSGAPHTLRSNSAMFWGQVPLLPLRAMVRASPGTFMDVGADLGWMDVGLQLRAGQLDARRRLPWGIELEWRTGQHTMFNYEARRVRVYRARAELYPALGTVGRMDAFGVVSLGASTGTMYHYMSVPAPFDIANEGPGSAGLEVVRPETRLEMSLGAHGRVARAAFTIALQPWLALHQGRVSQASCEACTLELQSLSVPWGLGIVASGSIVLEKK